METATRRSGTRPPHEDHWKPKRSKLDRPMPAFLWNPTRWQTDRRVQRMTWAQRGLYRELLDESYLRNGLPTDPSQIAAMLAKSPESIKPELDVVLQCFEIDSEGKLRSSIIEDERMRQNEYRRSMIRTTSADVRRCAPPRMSERNGSRVEVEVEVKAKENLKTKSKAYVFAVPDWIPLESWQGFVELRKRKRAPFTDRAVRLIVGKLTKFRDEGQDVGEILDQSVERGWTGVFPLKQVNAGKSSRHVGFAGRDYQEGRVQNPDGSFKL